jgi:hypothetical protein
MVDFGPTNKDYKHLFGHEAFEGDEYRRIEEGKAAFVAAALAHGALVLLNIQRGVRSNGQEKEDESAMDVFV